MASPVLNPVHLRPSVLPQKIKTFYQNKLENYNNISSIKGSQFLINTGIELLNKGNSNPALFKSLIKEFDRLVNTDYKAVYSEFIESDNY